MENNYNYVTKCPSRPVRGNTLNILPAQNHNTDPKSGGLQLYYLYHLKFFYLCLNKQFYNLNISLDLYAYLKVFGQYIFYSLSIEGKQNISLYVGL